MSRGRKGAHNKEPCTCVAPSPHRSNLVLMISDSQGGYLGALGRGYELNALIPVRIKLDFPLNLGNSTCCVLRAGNGNGGEDENGRMTCVEWSV